MTKRRIHAKPRRFWNKADAKAFKARYPHEPTADIARDLGRTVKALYQRAKMLGLAKTPAYLASPAAHRLDGVKGMGSRFPKGHVPANKGLRRPGWGPGRMKQTQFKKGGRSPRWPAEDYPIGALRINSDGQLDMKVRDGLRGWYCLARWVWMQERGQIPPNHCIRPKNGDQHDTRIENLELITRAENLRRNWHDRYPLAIKQAVQLRGALQRQINKREGKHEQHDKRSS
jgi:hypothetical protein